MMDQLCCSCNDVCELLHVPIQFLETIPDNSAKIINLCSDFYGNLKSNSKTMLHDPLTELLVTGFDDEQIWQQIDIFNNNAIQTCGQGASVCLNNWVQLDSNFSEVTDATSNKQLSDEESSNVPVESDKDTSASENEKCEEKKEVFEKTEVDDDFFSLRQMEKFLDAEEAGPQPMNSSDEIDYFDDIPSTDNDEKDDFNENSIVDSDDDLLMHDVDDNAESDVVEDSVDKETNKSAREVKYDEFFSTSHLQDKKTLDKSVSEKESLTNLEKQQRKFSQQIRTFEEQALADQTWQMKGEAVASTRPVNSLLEEVLTYDHSERLAPEITDEHTNNVETIICQRIKDKSWDDVERKIKEVKDPNEFKKKVVLDSEQSKLSLQQIYEKEYLAKMSKECVDDKENPARIELNKLMTDLFTQLDALANYHFRSAVPEPEIKVVTNLPSIAMEEIQPVTHTDADMLAPEEIHDQKELKCDSEKSKTDKKRERRKKVARQKARAKAKMQKLEKLADTNEKLQTLKAVKQLQQAAKRKSGQTTIIKEDLSKKKRQMSSRAFFDKFANISR